MHVAKVLTTRVKKAGINPYVDLPAGIGRALTEAEDRRVLVRLRSAEPGTSMPLPIGAEERERLARTGRMTRDGWFRTTIVPVRGAARRLFLDTWMRRSAGLAVGARALVQLRAGRRSRDLPVPKELQDSLAEDPRAKHVWEQWAPSRRKQALAYLNFLRSKKAMERTIRKVPSD